MKFVIYAALALASSSSLFAAKYDVDKGHSSVGFGVKHLVISTVKGSFKEFEGNFEYDDASKTFSSATGTIQVASIDTNDKKRDDHLRNPDFFGVDAKNAKSPNNVITYKLNKFEGGKAHGDITIKGVTKPIVLDVEVAGTIKDPWGNDRVGFDAKGRLNRKDFGLNWNKTLDNGGLVVGDEVSLEVHVEGIKAKNVASGAKK